jgi:hypothetical protein
MNNKIFSIFTFLVILGTVNLSAQLRTRNERLNEAIEMVTLAEERREQAGFKLATSNTAENSDTFLRADSELTRCRRHVERLGGRR